MVPSRRSLFCKTSVVITGTYTVHFNQIFPFFCKTSVVITVNPIFFPSVFAFSHRLFVIPSFDTDCLTTISRTLCSIFTTFIPFLAIVAQTLYLTHSLILLSYRSLIHSLFATSRYIFQSEPLIPSFLIHTQSITTEVTILCRRMRWCYPGTPTVYRYGLPAKNI